MNGILPLRFLGVWNLKLSLHCSRLNASTIVPVLSDAPSLSAVPFSQEMAKRAQTRCALELVSQGGEKWDSITYISIWEIEIPLANILFDREAIS